MIDGSEKRKRQLVFELQSSRVYEKRSNILQMPYNLLANSIYCTRFFFQRQQLFQRISNQKAIEYLTEVYGLT